MKSFVNQTAIFSQLKILTNKHLQETMLLIYGCHCVGGHLVKGVSM